MRLARGQQRHHLVYYLPVHDQATDAPLGFVGDITAEGVMVLGPQPLEAGRELAIEIRGRAEGPAAPVVRCRARSVWTHRDVNPDFYASGLQFEELPPESRQAVHALIRDIGFDS